MKDEAVRFHPSDGSVTVLPASHFCARWDDFGRARRRTAQFSPALGAARARGHRWALRDEQLTITNFTGHPSLTMRAGFIEVSEARSDWAPDPDHPLPTFTPPRRVPHGITLLGRLFEDGLIGQEELALERAFGVVQEHPPGF